MNMEPTTASIRLPEGYGSPKRTLDWPAVRNRLEQAQHYWLATTRPDGRPHVVPVDGLWVDGAWYFGGHSDTVHQRNVRNNPEVAIHLQDAIAAVIAEGIAEWTTPAAELAQQLSAASKHKYGYAPPPQAYLEGTWRLRPRRVVAWTSVAEDPTRFTFEAS
jgi:nitroimidazol reductase NimA-like FMN-containing flavoprotein (pyridoxamine 5'-phosphate oxidase superfamily)